MGTLARNGLKVTKETPKCIQGFVQVLFIVSFENKISLGIVWEAPADSSTCGISIIFCSGVKQDLNKISR